MDVTDAAEQQRYEARIDGELAGIAEYRASDGLVTFLHTEVMPGFEGRGVGSGLVRRRWTTCAPTAVACVRSARS